MDLSGDGSLEGWLPVIGHPGPPASLEWCWSDGELRAPFFEGDVQRWLSHPFNHAFRRRTDLGAVVTEAARLAGPPVRGVILHQSRCGSTLLASMLGAAGVRVLSEVGVIDAVARAPGLGDEERAAAIRSLVSVLGRSPDRSGGVVVKLDSWATRSLDHYRRAFGRVPMAFVYRDPVAVVVSQLRRRAVHTVPGALDPALFGSTFSGLWEGSAAAGVAQVVASISEAVLDAADAGLDIAFVRYDDLPAAASFVAGRFGIPVDGAEPAMAAVAEVDAKNPVLAFADDTAAKEAEATPEVRDAVGRWLAPVHARLDEARARQRSGASP